ncbi:MAG: DUF4142 domain-containing protein [Armatimonadetes bacterium]|nr:DUF4142 domain-containing protein [Armatimonadota bacterium]
MKRSPLFRPLIGVMLCCATLLVVTQRAFAQPSDKDANFIRRSNMGHMMEVKLGELAQRQGRSKFVKMFGAMMVKDHNAAHDEVVQLARIKGVKIDDGLDAEHYKVFDRLSKLNGAAFDRAYRALMLDDHKKDYAAFDRMTTAADDNDVRNYAMRYAPLVKSHWATLKKGKMS